MSSPLTEGVAILREAEDGRRFVELFLQPVDGQPAQYIKLWDNDDLRAVAELCTHAASHNAFVGKGD